jgi:Kef-type K+ transport system membrane component KefB/Trk K+ transport system NAD-binding subunit
VSLFFELSIIIVVAAALSGLMRLLKQPIVIGYILTGLLLGPHFLNLIKSTETVSIFSEMGIAILLFIVGLHLSPKEIKDFGGKTFATGLVQVLLTAFFGFLVSRLFGFPFIESVYLGAALSFSSTIIVLKLLSDKRDLEKLYGRITVGILLFQDIVAAFALIFSSSFSDGGGELANFVLLVIKGLILTLIISLLSVYVLPSLSTFFARSQEYLFLFSLAWGFGLSALFGFLKFSVEIGALVAGVSLSMSPYSQEISSKLKPLRDFFVVIFFILLGSKISFVNFDHLLMPFIVMLIFIVLIKPLLVTIILEFFGYNGKTAFFSGVSLAQISEFSLILLMLGLKLGHIREETLSLVIILGFASIAISTYFIAYVERIYPVFIPFISLFERKKVKPDDVAGQIHDVILFGCNRSGYDFIKIFKYFGRKFLAVDFDPEIIKQLNKRGINCCYGDAEDGEFLDEVSIGKAKIVVSTIPEYETNAFLVSKIREENENSIVFLISYSIDDAIKLYEKGATYVVLPHFISGEFAAKLTTEAGFDIKKLRGKRDEHIKYLKERKALGHSHPTWTHF